MEKWPMRSLRGALLGLSVAWREELNFRIQIACGAVALLFAWAFQLTQTEVLIVCLTIALVLSVEVLNTSLEAFCDMVRENPDPHVAKIKDLGAAAALIAHIFAFAVGFILFGPLLMQFI